MDEFKIESITDLIDRVSEHLNGYNAAMALLHRAVDHLSDNPPDSDWFHDLYMLTGEHMILTDEGWQPGDCKQAIIDEYSADAILDEINAQP